MEEPTNPLPKPRVRKSGCGCGGGRRRQVLSERKEASATEVTEIPEVSATVTAEESLVTNHPEQPVFKHSIEEPRPAPIQTVTSFLAKMAKSRPRTKRKHK